jgi:poly-gamma-glutamate synthesis protein (capsule biosynthesis protein)
VSTTVTISGVGDVLVERPDPLSAFTRVRAALDEADVLFGNCEAVYSTTRERNASSPLHWVIDSHQFGGVRSGGFDVLSLANNRIMDGSYAGLADILSLVRASGIEPVGAGETIDIARRPVVLERRGVRVGFLAYTCAYTAGFEASPVRPGCATIAVETVYRGEVGQPGTRPSVWTFVEPGAKCSVLADVEGLRPRVHVVIVSMHWGLHSLPAVLSDYERELGRAVIDAGADAVFGHHQHIIKGVEVHRGKPIFYGLGNFLLDGARGSVHDSGADLGAFAPFAPFYGECLTPGYPQEAKRSMLVRLRGSNAGLAAASFVPCTLNDAGNPVVVEKDGSAFAEYLEYVRDINVRARLEADLSARGGEIIVRL